MSGPIEHQDLALGESSKFQNPGMVLAAINSIDSIIQITSDVNVVLDQVMEKVREIFNSSRAWLFHPCNPKLPSFEVAFEFTTSEYPGAKTLKQQVPMTEDMADYCHRALSAIGGPEIDPPEGLPVTNDIAIRFNVKTMLFMALRPKSGEPWMFGLHQCDRDRAWTSDEKQLFYMIGQRITGCIDSFLYVQQLRESEALLNYSQQLSSIGSFVWDLKTNDLQWSKNMYRIHGIEENAFVTNLTKISQELIHPHDQDRVRSEINRMIAAGRVWDMEFRIMRSDGVERIIRSSGEFNLDKNGKPLKCIGVHRDITEPKQAENVLVNQRKRLDYILQGTNVGTWEWNVLTGEVFFNERWADIIGYTLEELSPLSIDTWVTYCHPDDFKESERLLQLCFDKASEYYHCECRMRHKNGNWIWVLDRGKVFTWTHDGKPEWMCGTHQDITELKSTEIALRESKKRFERMLGVVPDMISIHDPEMNILYSNWQGFGAIPKEKRLIYTKCYKTYRGFDSICPDCRAKEVMDSGRSLQEEVRLPGGTWCDLRVIPITNNEGHIEMFMEWVRDITDRKQFELELQSQKRLLEGVLDSIKDVIGVQLPDHTMLKYNRAGYELLGLTEADIKGKKCYELIGRKNPCDICASTNSYFSKTMETIEQYIPELGRYFLCTSNPVLDDERNIKVIIEQLHDITEQKRTEEHLRQAQKMESVGRLAGGVAHDFNNMLSVILGNTEMALEEIDPNQPLFANLEEVRKAALRSADITGQLLAFARKQTIAPKVLNLNKTVQNSLKMIQRLIGEDIDLTWIPGEKVWPIKTDPSQIDQILTNLCVNARDAIADVGKVTIETNNVVIDEAYCEQHVEFMPGEYTMLAVSDSGCGMDSDTLENVFEPFFTTKSLDKGTGLGLSSVFGTVKQNNGFINVYSEPNHGTTFKIYLPRHKTEGVKAPDEKADQSIAQGNATILLVEDELSILKTTTMMLERLGYTVMAAETPGEAIELAVTHTGEINLLMTDVVMPEMNGRDLAKNILSLYPGLKFLFMSGYTANVIAHHGVLDEGVNFIQKPFSRAQLGAKVQEALGSGEA
jgi:two-component system cell cycle sensor histidine kinase/response regulator CckA